MGKSADWSALIPYTYDAMCCDSVCKCPYSLGGDLAMPSLSLGDCAIPTDKDSVTG